MAGNRAEARAEVEEVIRRYFTALDNRDRPTMLSVFADNAQIDYDGQFHALGLTAIREFFESGVASASIGITVDSTVHVMAHALIDAGARTATARTHAVAYLSGARDDRHIVFTRGLRYVDRFERRADGWQIVERSHRCLWTVEHPAVQWHPSSVLNREVLEDN
jgi:uncharacterized protein (TIGR02246 family)